MRPRDVRFAAAARDDGIHKISKFTWRAGAAGVVCSALIAAAFGHHVATNQSSTDNGGSSQSQQSPTGSNGGGSNQGSTGQGSSDKGNSDKGNSHKGNSHKGSGGIVVPAQPPAPSQGGGQVTSGAS